MGGWWANDQCLGLTTHLCLTGNPRIDLRLWRCMVCTALVLGDIPAGFIKNS